MRVMKPKPPHNHLPLSLTCNIHSGHRCEFWPYLANRLQPDEKHGRPPKGGWPAARLCSPVGAFSPTLANARSILAHRTLPSGNYS
jgi:hypothetical protein